MVAFFHTVRDERDGHCKALLWDRGAVELCNRPTRRGGHPYCYDCWLEVDGFLEDAAAFPPRDAGGNETRVALGLTRTFLLTQHQFRQYGNGGGGSASSAATPASENSFLFVGPVKPNPAWARGDEAHQTTNGRWTVYVIRLQDGSVYVGQTRKSAQERFEEHTGGAIGARIARDRGTDRLLYHTECVSRQAALEAEKLVYEALRRCGIRVSIGKDPDG